MGFSIGGLGSGLDTAALVQSLMQAERVPLTKIQARQTAAQKQVAAWNDLRAKMQSVQSAAEALQTPAKALSSAATSSNKDALSATTRPGALPGRYAVVVDQLAVAQQQTRTGLGPPSMTVGAGRSHVAAGPLSSALDLSAAPAGAHTVQVTRGSSAATVYGNPVLAVPTDLTVAVDGGAPLALALRSTHTDEADLLADLNGQLTGIGTASVVGGRLQIRSTSEGSASSLQFGGSAAAALGLPSTAATGTSAVVVVDGVSHTVDPVPAGQPARRQTFDPSGVALSVGDGLRPGTTRATVVVTTETSTLADLQSMLNVTGSPVSAAVIAEGTGSSLVLSSTGTGADGALHVVAGTSVLAGLTETQPAKDAVVTVAGRTVTRSTNTLDDVLPGVTLNLLHRPADGAPLTVTVARDSTGTADKARNLVDTLNLFLGKVASDTKYDVRTKSGGPLVGDSTARGLSATLFSKAASTVGAGTIRSLGQLGLESTRDGRFTLKSEVLTAALAQDPDGVAATLAGFADAVAVHAKEVAQTGGVMTSRRDGAQATADARQKQIDSTEARLAAVEKRYKAQYAALETSMAALNSQRTAMGAALTSFTGAAK